MAPAKRTNTPCLANLLFLLTILLHHVFSEVRYEGPRYVFEGESFEIACYLDEYRIPKWFRGDDPVTEGGGYDATLESDRKNGVQKAVLVVGAASFLHSGDYSCDRFDWKTHALDVLPNPRRDRSNGASRSRHGDAEPGCVLLEKGKTVTLDCARDQRSFPAGTQFSWLKSPLEINDAERLGDLHKYVFRMKNNRRYEVPSHAQLEQNLLTLNDVSNADAGVYMCSNIMNLFETPPEKQTPGVTTTIGQVFYLVAPIKMLDSSERVIAVKNKNFVMDCNVDTAPLPTITWFIGNEDLMVMSRQKPRVSFENGGPNNSIPNARLVIRDVDYSDVAAYTCRASHLKCGIMQEITRQLYVSGL